MYKTSHIVVALALGTPFLSACDSGNAQASSTVSFVSAETTEESNLKAAWDCLLESPFFVEPIELDTGFHFGAWGESHVKEHGYNLSFKMAVIGSDSESIANVRFQDGEHQVVTKTSVNDARKDVFVEDTESFRTRINETRSFALTNTNLFEIKGATDRGSGQNIPYVISWVDYCAAMGNARPQFPASP